MVPEGWKLIKLGDYIKLSSGDTKPSDIDKSYSEDKPYPVYGGNNIMGYSSFYNSSEDVILIGRVGEYCGVTRYIIQSCWITDNALYTKTVSKELAKDFLSRKLQYIDLSRLRNKGGQPLISQKPIYSLKLNIPPLQEQKKIAQILSTWDNAITTTEKLLKNSQQQKKALMQQLLTGKKRLKGFSGEFRRFHSSQLLEIDKQNLGSKTKPDFRFYYISLSDVSPGVINSSLEKFNFRSAPSRARRIVQDGDILLATVRPNLQGFARVRKVNDGAIASTGFAVLTPKSNVCGDYVYHYLFGAHITGQINALVVGTNYPAINSSDVAGLCIYCPCYEEQKEIAEVLNNCDSTTRSLNNKLEKLKQEKKALMQQLLTGKKRVKLH